MPVFSPWGKHGPPGSVGPEVSYSAGGEAKALITDAIKAPNVGAGDALTGSGAGGIGLGGLLKGAEEQLSPMAGAGGFIDQAVAVMIIAGVVVGVGGYAWRLYAKRQRDKRADALGIAPAQVPA
ncbi:hypothetical protein [Pararhizobium sp.]|uniref:hypothetical protein n=1 Tax=Pararhizobium sp. TaxID=1977563 RepID=UPI003BA8FB3C